MALNLDNGHHFLDYRTGEVRDVDAVALIDRGYRYQAPSRKVVAAGDDMTLEVKSASGPHRMTDSKGNVFTYTVANDEFVRIDRCQTSDGRLVFPEEIDGLPVLWLGTGLCEENDLVEEVVCPRGVLKVGPCAFRSCARLRRLVLPDGLREFSASWVQHCNHLEELVLPDRLERLTRAVFENPGLKRLAAGRHLAFVEPGACENSHLETFTLASGNPFLETDGVGIYSADGASLLALVRPVSAYDVAEGCKVVARKAAKGMASLREVGLPSGLEIIEPFAFAHTGVVQTVLPDSLCRLEEKAFFHCADLRQAQLNDGLQEMGDCVFAESGLESLKLPASVRIIGASITDKSNVVHSGEHCTFAVDESSPTLYFDGQGGLYRKKSDGLHFIQLVDRQVDHYAVVPGTVGIEGYSFAFHDAIETVEVPEGVLEVGSSAFRVCRRLRKVALPDSVRSIGKEAFLDTVLESFKVPRDLHDLGSDALVTAGAHHSSEPHSLKALSVAGGNERFYVESGVLCERGRTGDRALMFDDATPHVELPVNVTSVAPYAFNNAQGIRSLTLGERLRTIGACGFTTWSKITNLDITLAQPEEGRCHFAVQFPDIERSRHEISLSLGGSSWVNVPEIFRHYDNCVINARDYHNDEGISPRDQVVRILARLADPIFLTPVSRSIFERVVRLNFGAICRDVARCDDRGTFNAMADFGFLTDETIEEALCAVQPLQDAAMMGHLLELKRERFGCRTMDFEL